VIAGLIMHVFVKFFTFKLFNFQRNWPGETRDRDGATRRWHSTASKLSKPGTYRAADHLL
jgi:hypothetical protein